MRKVLLSLNSTHPEVKTTLPALQTPFAPIEVETFDGKIQIEWDPNAKVVP